MRRRPARRCDLLYGWRRAVGRGLLLDHLCSDPIETAAKLADEVLGCSLQVFDGLLGLLADALDLRFDGLPRAAELLPFIADVVPRLLDLLLQLVARFHEPSELSLKGGLH